MAVGVSYILKRAARKSGRRVYILKRAVYDIN